MSAAPVSDETQTAIVLIVEDEALQRMDMVDMAENAGFAVLEAYNADHAIALLETRADVRIIITDIDMPGDMDGKKLATFVRTRWPPIEIIIVAAGVAPSSDNLPDRAIFMPKPLNYERVVAAMNKFL